jgi:F-type H+-transporting ATPase subunit b
MLDLDPGMMIWAWITFVILLTLLYRFAWKPILSVVDKRERTIQDSLDKAKHAQEEAEALLNRHQEMMQKAEEEARKFLSENRELAEKSKHDILEQARQSAQTILDKAKQEIEREKEAAVLALRSEVADLAISATRKIIGESLDEARQRSLIEEYVGKIPKTTKN